MSEKNWINIISSFGSGLFGSLVGISYAIIATRDRKDQNKYQDAKENLSILLCILEDLNILNQAYVFRGIFCPQIEHRVPSLSYENGDGQKMSYAQRAHQFQMIGYRIINNCRKMICLVPESHLPKTLTVCKEIIKSLRHRKTLSSKTHLDYMISTMISCLSKQDSTTDKQMNQFAQQLQQWHDSLEQEIEEELPFLWG